MIHFYQISPSKYCEGNQWENVLGRLNSVPPREYLANIKIISLDVFPRWIQFVNIWIPKASDSIVLFPHPPVTNVNIIFVRFCCIPKVMLCNRRDKDVRAGNKWSKHSFSNIRNGGICLRKLAIIWEMSAYCWRSLLEGSRESAIHCRQSW